MTKGSHFNKGIGFLTFLDHLLDGISSTGISVIQYFRSCAMSSVSWYFFMSPCMLSLHHFFGRPLLLLPETSSRNDFAHMWLGSRLKQWTNHFSLLFSRKVSTCFISDVVQRGLPSCPSQHPHFG